MKQEIYPLRGKEREFLLSMWILIANQTIALKLEGIGGWFTINFASVSITYNTTKKTRGTEENVPISLYFRLCRCLSRKQRQHVCKATILQKPRKIFSSIGCPSTTDLGPGTPNKSAARNQFCYGLWQSSSCKMTRLSSKVGLNH